MELHKEIIREVGASWEEANKVLIMLHGRGASAEDILSLRQYLKTDNARMLAPQATGHTANKYIFSVFRKERVWPWNLPPGTHSATGELWHLPAD